MSFEFPLDPPYELPFRVENQVIRDARGREVRLWGVNYYAPFNHNYVNLCDKGIDPLRAIDRDIADFKKLGVQLVRMHLFDREISDLEGNLVENDHLRVYDYLMDRLEANGIYVMVTTMAWWNSTQTQNFLRKAYAHCTLGDTPALGFANLAPKHALIWHPRFMAYQERYMRQLFEHPSRFSGKRLTEYRNVVAIEVINEPDYPRPAKIAALRQDRAEISKNPIRREELLLVDWFDQRVAAGTPDTEAAQSEFCAELIEKYLDRMFGVVDEYFQGKVLKTHIFYDFTEPAVRKVLTKTKAIDCISVAFYGGGFATTTSIPQRLMLEETVMHYTRRYEEGRIQELGKALICYEWAMQCTLTGFDMPATAHMMAALGVQIAAYFTYTPRDLAEYNPGWLQQYLSVTHTPRRAIGFLAGGAVFRRTARGNRAVRSEACWGNDWFLADAAKDLSLYEDGETYIAAGDAPDAPRFDTHRVIAGAGSNARVWREGNGAYFLRRMSEAEWRLTVLPDQFYVNDPFWGKRYEGTGFPNRDTDVNHVPVVSRLKEAGSRMRLSLPGFESFRLERLSAIGPVPVEQSPDGAFVADPGEYRVLSISHEKARDSARREDA